MRTFRAEIVGNDKVDISSHEFSSFLSRVLRTRELLFRREAHASQQVVESRVRTQAVKSRFYFQENDTIRVLLISFLQPDESLILLAQTGIYQGDVVGRDGSQLCLLAQLIEQFDRLASLTRHRIGVSEWRDVGLEPWIGDDRLPEAFNSFRVSAFLRIRSTEPVARRWKLRIHLKRLLILFDGAVILTHIEKWGPHLGVDDQRKRVEFQGALRLSDGFVKTPKRHQII